MSSRAITSEPKWGACQRSGGGQRARFAYGLAIVPRRRSTYSRIAPGEAHEIAVALAMVKWKRRLRSTRTT